MTTETAISVDGVPICFEVRGNGQPALVFVHGWCCDRSYWEEQLFYFEQSCRVVTVDLAGHGDSGFEREIWTIAKFGEDVVAVIEKLDPDRVVLVGHSMGGPVILHTANEIPDRVIGVVGVDTFHDINRKLSQVEIDTLLDPIRSDFSATINMFVRHSYFTPESDPALIEKIAVQMSETPPEMALAAAEDLFKQDIISLFQETPVPIRAINSDQNFTDIETAQRYASSFKVEFMPGRGHFIMMEDSKTFNRVLSELILEFVRP